ncbi:MAG: RNA polymerase sigma factor [Turicibacter sp.]|nr:RNA polymerase sigma factor [Turicibacter sp.]
MAYQIEDLIETYSERLLRYATSILYHHQDAEDVVQDVFVAAYQHLDTFDGKHLSAWLYRITYNKSINLLRRRKVLPFGEVPVDTVVENQNNDFSERTLQALGKLKPQERALLYGRIVEGYCYEELAEQMGVRPATLRKRYERAKAKLAAILKEEHDDDSF